ncbi:MAG: GMC family oxidoreductase [Rhodobacteraceae bacterium]|nr:GMC family oxidoreductase [Paracoccaceae bacterium]
MRSSRQRDVIVVGAGLGGASAAWQLAESGLDVLVVEAGPDVTAPLAAKSAYARLAARLQEPAVPEQEDWDAGVLSYYERGQGGVSPRRVATRLGQGLGGTSVRYAAALGRFRRSDFAGSVTEGRAPILPNAWPIGYDEFRGHYARAESLLRVCGERDPLDPDDDAELLPPPGLSAAAEALRASLAAKGHTPFRLHVGLDYLPGCIECFGARCARACKADGYNRALQPALATGRVALETGLRVEAILPDVGGVAVLLRDREGVATMRRARRIILAAGALNSPLILGRSAALWGASGPPAMLGRGLMFHVSDFFLVMSRREADGQGPRKWLALRDFYADGEAGIGEIQSTGYSLETGSLMQAMRGLIAGLPLRPAPWMVEALRPLAWSMAGLIGPRPIFTTITEDLPDARNHVRSEGGRIVVEYSVDAALKRRAAANRARIRAVFAPFGVHFLGRHAQPNWGHPMGTCRMGLDPRTSVTDPEGRVHGQPRIYVADASVFPSSGGAGPALTVVANALRVADGLAAASRAERRHAPAPTRRAPVAAILPVP